MMKLLRYLSLSLLMPALLAGASQAGEPAEPASDVQGLMPLAKAEWSYANARHLLWRAGFGGTPQEVDRLYAMGLDQAVDLLIDYEGIEYDHPLEITCKQQPQIPKGIKKDGDKARALRKDAQKAEREQYQDLRAWWIKRMIESPRPLEEKLTLFWHGLLVSGYGTVKDSYAMYKQNQLYRTHAAGNYGELLHCLVHDAAMLHYLDNNSNVRGRPNENLAREIMELFSMGEGQGYTEQDIAEAARALTGNIYDREAKFVFRAKTHDPGVKTIFGETGKFDGDDVVDLILKQPATARYLSQKLFTYFAYENPDQLLVDGLARELAGCDYELRPMLKTLFKSKAFYSEQCVARQIKSPVQLVIGSVRALDIGDKVGVDKKDLLAIAQATSSMEQDIFQPPNVKGWDGGEAWINTTTVFARYNFAGRFEYKLKPKWNKKTRSFPKGYKDAITLLRGHDLKDSAAVVDYLIKALFAVPPSAEDRSQLIAFLDEGGMLPPSARWGVGAKENAPEQRRRRIRINEKLTALIVLMMSVPEYQVS